MFDVITIGSATIDFFVKTNFPFVPWDTPLKQAIAIPFGEKFSARDSLITTGGNAVNTATTFRRQGLKTATVIKIGRDIPGEMIQSRLHLEGVENKFIIRDNSIDTSRSVLLLQNGERSIITYQGAGASLSITDLKFNEYASKWWYVSLAGDSYKLFPFIAKKAKEMGVKLAINPTAKHLRDGKSQLIANLKYVDFLVLNEGEAALLTGISFVNDKEVFRKIDKLAPGIVAITGGDKGSVISDGKNIYKTGIFKGKKALDRTGAGDAYGAGFVAGLIRTKEKCERLNFDPEKIKYAIRLATTNAASVVQKIGASENALSRKDFDNTARYQKLKIDIQKI